MDPQAVAVCWERSLGAGGSSLPMPSIQVDLCRPDQ